MHSFRTFEKAKDFFACENFLKTILIYEFGWRKRCKLCLKGLQIWKLLIRETQFWYTEGSFYDDLWWLFETCFLNYFAKTLKTFRLKTCKSSSHFRISCSLATSSCCKVQILNERIFLWNISQNISFVALFQ